jgi:cobalt/nickel transport protein
MTKNKKYLLFILIMVVLTPLGIVVPNILKSGNAWGEWSVETIKDKTGVAPEGMKKNAEIYKSPVSDYNTGKESDPLFKRSTGYFISALIGTGIILILTFGATLIISRKQKE